MSTAVKAAIPINSQTALQATARAEAKNFALLILRDPTYRQNLIVRARAGTLAPAVEIALWHYAYGKPAERLEVGGPGAFGVEHENLTDRQLGDRIRLLAEIVEQGGNPDDPLPTMEELERKYDDAREAALVTRLKHIDYEENRKGLNGSGSSEEVS